MALPDIPPYPLPELEGLPRNTAAWTPDPDRAVLLVHDMQEYFLRPFDTTRQPLSVVLDHCDDLRTTCRGGGLPVIYSAQPGGMSAEDRGLLMDIWGPGMPADSGQSAVTARLKPATGDTVITKWRASAFVRTELLETLRRWGRDQIILCGVYAHVGILTTASDAFAHDIQAFLAADAIADFTAEHHRQALAYAATRCAVVLSTADVLAALNSPRSVTDE